MTSPRTSTPLLHHRIDGPDDAPPLLLGPSLGTSLKLWDALVPQLSRRHRVIRWDLPGHGATPACVLPDLTPGRTTVADLGALVLTLADALGVDRFAYAGVSLGGAVGTWLAVHHPQRVASLTAVCSAARFAEPAAWQTRAAQVRTQGLEQLAAGAPARWFTPAFAGTPTADALVEDHRACDRDGYAACCDALAGFDLRAELGRISAPALVVAGRQDLATPPANARELADGIPGAALVEIPGAAHLDPDPAPDLAGATREETHAAGMRVRRAVLGDAHVDRAAAGTTAFTAPFQDLITRYAWGEIWTRPGLDRRTRSCITLTALVALGHHQELAMHVRAARSNGLSAAEIGEVLLQAAIYCGVPAANSAFAVANAVLEELEGEPRP